MLQLTSWQDNRMAAQTSSRWSSAKQGVSTTGSNQAINVRQETCLRQGLFTLGPSKAEPSQAERGKVFTLAIMFTLGCVGCHASEVRRRVARFFPKLTAKTLTKIAILVIFIKVQHFPM